MTILNGFNPKDMKDFVSEIEGHLSDMATEQGSYMSFCKGKREEIKAVYQRVKDAGIPLRDFKAMMKERELKSKISGLRAEMDDGGETMDMMLHALGELSDTPLGQAAVKNKEKSDAIDALAGDPDVTASNVTKLKNGIKNLQ